MFTHVAYGRDTSKLPAPITLQSVKPKRLLNILSCLYYKLMQSPFTSRYMQLRYLKVTHSEYVEMLLVLVCVLSFSIWQEIGKWDPKNAPVLNGKNFPVWETILQVPRHELPSKYLSTSILTDFPWYKFVWVSADSATVIWEDSPNRYLGDISQNVALITTSLAVLMFLKLHLYCREAWNGKEQESLFPFFHSEANRAAE